MTTSLVIYVILPAFMWAGGPDVPDALYDWHVKYVSSSDYSIIGGHPAIFSSRNQCDVNRRYGGITPPPGTYLACLPTLKPKT
jgi:hypothetical protein